MVVAERVEVGLYPQQYDFVVWGGPFSAFIGGVGSGKTHAGAVKALDYVSRNPGSLGLIGAPTFPMLRDATLREVEAVFPQRLIKEFNRGEMRMTLANGAEILFRSCDDPEHLRGPNLAWYWLDEGARAKRDAWFILQARLRQPEMVHQAWVTTTPKGYNWLWQEFGTNDRSDYMMFHASARDNPFLPPDFIRRLEESYADKEFALQEIEGQFVIVGGKPFFHLDALRIMRADLIAPTETKEGCVSVWKQPIVAGKYVAGCDPCWGQTGSYACTVILDWQTGEQVAEIHGRLQPDEMAQKTVDLCTLYNKAFLGIEANGEGRNAVAKAIALSYGSRMYHRHEDWLHREDKQGWFTDAGTRPVMLGDLEEAIRLGQMRIHCTDAHSEMMSFVRNDKGTPDAAEGAYDDHVSALAIAWQMRKHAHWGDTGKYRSFRYA